MIRSFEKNDTDMVMQIWLSVNMKTHDFIPQSYWIENYDNVKAALPLSNIFVYEEENIIKGFIGVISDYIAGIFIKEDAQSQGIGKRLMDHVKKFNNKLFLQVYQKNTRAIMFYQREQFVIQKEQTDEATGEKEMVMLWNKK